MLQFFNFNFHLLSKRGFAKFVWGMSILIKTTNSVYKPLTAEKPRKTMIAVSECSHQNLRNQYNDSVKEEHL